MERMDRTPGAFMSYAHVDDDDGRLTEFRNKLSAQTRKVVGEEFPIFQDHEDIKWGQEWEARIDESLAEVTFFIPIITPSFFRSKFCRDELTRFLEREERLGLKLILPVYYIETPLIRDESRRSSDELAQKIASRQYADCRDLFIEDLDSPRIRRLMFDLATQICDTLEGLPLEPIDPSVTASSETITAQQIPNSSRPKTPNRDIVVDPMHRGDCTTVSEAIEAANPGDKILVRPGLYHEGLVIDKPMEIIGEGERDEIVIQATGEHAILFKTTIGRAANLTLRQMGGEGELYGVDIAQGRLTLEDCDISSHCAACVAIHDGADPRLRRNKIHNGNKSGVYVFNNGQGIIEENDILENAFAGFSIEVGGNPTLRKNLIHDGKGIGINVYNNGRGIIEENDIFRNDDSGVEIRTGGNPILRHNKINGNIRGVKVSSNGQGLIQDNNIFENTYAGVDIQSGGNPTVRRNRINKNGLSAIWIYNNGSGVIQNNDLRGSEYGALDISDDSKPNVERSGNLE